MRVFIVICLLLSSCASSPRSDRKGLFDISGGPGGWEQTKIQGSCPTLSKEDRKRLLALANPENFPNTRYRKGPRRSIDQETDCSHFVHEVYRRAGLPFDFRTTRYLKEAPEFELLPEREAKPGDLMLFRGHVGIIDENGLIISATKTRGKKRSSITRLERRNFRPARGSRTVLRYRCRPGPQHLAQEQTQAQARP